MLTLVTTVHVTAALFIICIVLLQGGSSGGLGAGFGGGSGSSSMFGAAGPVSMLGKLTYVFAIIFMITSISLTIMQGTNYDIGLKEKTTKSQRNQHRGGNYHPHRTKRHRDKRYGHKISSGGEI